MTTTKPTDVNLHDLSAQLDNPLAVVTTRQVADARKVLARAFAGTDLAMVEEMLAVDNVGVIDGIARGLWTQVL